MLAALAEIRAHTGTQFCPVVVAALEELWRDPAYAGIVSALATELTKLKGAQGQPQP
jgi:hypothetical protein